MLSLAINSTGVANATTYLYKPDGSQWTMLSTLPANGVYTVRVNHNSNGTGTYTVTLSAPVTGTLVVNGAMTTQSVTRAG